MTKRNKSCESEVMLTMQRKELLKKSAIRHAEYYGMVEVQDALYADSANKKIFTDLISIIGSDANIKMAYRNLKSNKGSNTPGVDGKTFKDLAEMSEEALVRCVRDKILNYQPKAVRRVYIPKPNGKMRPLGIPTVIDRIVQQSVLQVMEPICEAKFYRHSYGFRPNRSTKNAVAVCYKLAQVDGFHYVVDVDIKGFFDNVDHGKLLKQIWTLGIRDKRLISLIGKMLKAPIEENGVRTVPDKGTPQGGVLSPLLANIVLNELDWWIASQWEEMPAKHPLKSDIYMNKNGTPNKGNLYKKLRQSRLKECHIVRYADDFKIFCKSYSDAVKLKHAVEQWLMDRLKLETSPDKSRITNLTKGYSDFLGIKFKLYKKGKKWSIKSHMTDKAINSQQAKLKNAMAQACKSHESEQSQHDDLIRYNQAVIGMHQYYNMATMINADVHRLFPSIDITMKTRLNSRADLSKERPPTLKGAISNKDLSHGTPCAMKVACTVWAGAKDPQGSDLSALLLKEEQTATYSVEIWKRFRKWGGLPTGITQNVKDLLRSPEIANILENSDFIYMLNQASDDRSILAQRLNISPHQLSYVTNSGEGEGLLFYGNVILPFIDRFPTDLELYRIMTTKLNEVAQEKEA